MEKVENNPTSIRGKRICRDILAFLENNPGIVDTAQSIALRICRDPELTQSVLMELCEAGVVKLNVSEGRMALFTLVSSDS